MLLLFLLFIPITGVLAILLIFREQVTGVVEVPSLVDVSNVVEVSNVMDIQSDNIKSIGLIASTLNFSVALIIFIMSDFSTNQFQFVQEYHEISYFDFYLGIDGLSIYFVLLTTLIIPISLLSNWRSISKDVGLYVITILLLETLLLAVFLVLDTLLFYIFFESILPPLFILIGVFGSDNRINAISMFRSMCYSKFPLCLSWAHSIYYLLIQFYNQYNKAIQWGVLLSGFTIVIYILGLSLIHSCILILLITILLGVLPFIWVNNTHILGVSPFIWVNNTHLFDLLGILIPIAVYTLTDSAITSEFYINYPNLSHIDIFLVHLGIARIIIGIIFTKNEGNYF